MARTRRIARALAGYGNVPGYTSAQVNRPTAPRGPASYTATTPSVTNDLPPDYGYDQQVAAYARARADKLNQLGRQRQDSLLGYGYSASYDPTSGNVASISYDPSNPYSQAALARKTYQQQKAGTSVGLASRRQLYSGALINAQNRNDTGFNVGEDARQKALINFLNNLRASELAAGTDYETSVGKAYGDRVSRAYQNPLYSPEAGGFVGRLPTTPPAQQTPQAPAPRLASGVPTISAGGSRAQRTTGRTRRRRA